MSLLRDVAVCIALVHNRNAQRNAYIQPRLEMLGELLSVKYAIRMCEVSFQPEMKPLPAEKGLLRDVLCFGLERDWRRYRGVRQRLLFLDLCAFLRRSIKKLWNRTTGGWQNGHVELMLTDKHIRAWSMFLETDADFLICFEDDAVFKDDSVQRIDNLLAVLIKQASGERVYVDLAGGHQLEALAIGNLETGQDSSFKYYRKPVTNSCGAYLMSRPLVSDFLARVTEQPRLRLIGADWMINKLFVLMESDGLSSRCMHAYPTIFKHGSATGEYVSMFYGKRTYADE